jgi:hypothetical protein
MFWCKIWNTVSVIFIVQNHFIRSMAWLSYLYFRAWIISFYILFIYYLFSFLSVFLFSLHFVYDTFLIISDDKGLYFLKTCQNMDIIKLLYNINKILKNQNAFFCHICVSNYPIDLFFLVTTLKIFSSPVQPKKKRQTLWKFVEACFFYYFI